jgi:histidinol-phosphate aminotransferase
MSFLRPDLDDLRPYTRPPEPEGLVRLHMNEAAADWPAPARDALLARLRGLPFRQYPERQGGLTERLRLRLGAPAGGVLLGPSSGALLDLVALAGLSEGDTVAVPEPGFSLYPLLVKRNRGRLLRVPVGDRFPLDPWFEALEEKPRQLWLTLPNNPTGAWLDPQAVEPLLRAAEERQVLVVMDEAYAEFAPGTHRLAPERFPNLLLLRTFAKAYACAAWRLGYVIGDPALIGRLAALQLPYSIPAPSLEALDVAMDFAADFEREIRATALRRDRLFSGLDGFKAAPSAGNFLLLRPDPSPDLREGGQLPRALPGEDAGRVSVGDEATAAKTAALLGGSLAKAPVRPPRRLLVLDLDGVLIDAEESFPEAVRRALADLRPDLPWSRELFTAFKRVGGFNNDFRLAAGALALSEQGDLDLLPRLRAAEGRGFPELEGRIRDLEPSAQAAVQRHYAETVALERPLLTRAELDLEGWDIATLTGRPPEELAFAWKVLGFQLPGLCDSAPHLRKPEPAGLLQLADAYRAEEVLFVGDTRDDAACLRAAAAIRPELSWRFAAVGADRDRLDADLRAATLRALLPDLKEDLP